MNTLKILSSLFLILIVTSPALGQEWTRPGQDGSEPVYNSGQLREGADQRIYILDMKAQRLKIYTPDGALTASLLRPGEGPGDIKRFEGLHFGFTPSGHLFFTEIMGGHRWITIMDTSGKFLQTITPRRKEPFYGFAGAEFLPDGNIIVAFLFPGKTQKYPKYYLYDSPIVFSLMKPDGTIIRDIYSENPITRISYLPDGGDIQIPFSPDPLWTCNTTAGLILATTNNPIFKRFLLPNGNLQSIPLPLPDPQPVSAEDLKVWSSMLKEHMMQRDGQWYMKFGKVAEELQTPVHNKKPFINSISITPQDHLLVSVYRDMGWQEREFYLFDSHFKPLAKIKPKDSISSVYLSRNLTFVYKTDNGNDDDEDEGSGIYWRKRKGTDVEILTDLGKPTK